MNNKNILTVGVLLILLGLLVVFDGKFSSNTPDREGEDVRYSIEEYRLEKEGLIFKYKAGPDGYVVENLSSFIGEEAADAGVVSAYRIIDVQEKAELEESTEGREGPPTINVIVFENTNNQSASMWVDAFPVLSNINLAIGDVNRDTVVGGANAVSYMTDGLYRARNVVVAHGEYMYMFVGSYLDEDSDIYRDFDILIDSLMFLPTNAPLPQAKLDVRVACESALVYMTFASGEEADAFVADCVEGKYPEVIERYISDMNVDGATI